MWRMATGLDNAALVRVVEEDDFVVASSVFGHFFTCQLYDISSFSIPLKVLKNIESHFDELFIKMSKQNNVT